MRLSALDSAERGGEVTLDMYGIKNSGDGGGGAEEGMLPRGGLM